jgi:transketolase
VSELIQALDKAREITGKPTMIVAHTIKGKGMPEIEDIWQSHAISDFSPEEAEKLINDLSCKL